MDSVGLQIHRLKGSVDKISNCCKNYQNSTPLKLENRRYLYNKAFCSYIFICSYVSYIAGQTAGPNGLTFYEGTREGGSNIGVTHFFSLK